MYFDAREILVPVNMNHLSVVVVVVVDTQIVVSLSPLQFCLVIIIMIIIIREGKKRVAVYPVEGSVRLQHVSSHIFMLNVLFWIDSSLNSVSIRTHIITISNNANSENRRENCHGRSCLRRVTITIAARAVGDAQVAGNLRNFPGRFFHSCSPEYSPTSCY